jgi:arginase family enzyme
LRSDSEMNRAQSYGSRPLPAKTKAVGLEQVRRVGVAVATQEALASASGKATRDFWIHFDVDVLDDGIMPAADYRLPGGRTWIEIEEVLSAALAHPKVVGIEITIFNPRLDADRSAALSRHDDFSPRTDSPTVHSLRKTQSDCPKSASSFVVILKEMVGRTDQE